VPSTARIVYASDRGDHIVVGVDGSPGPQGALDFAAAEAVLRGSTLQALHSWQCPVSDGGWVVPVTEYEDYARGVLVDAVAKTAPPDSPGATTAPVVADLQEGHPAERLLTPAQDADLLAVGSPGRGGFVGLLLRSVSQHCITHAGRPVVVVRAPSTSRGEMSS
jgi:nucleotide-binding universal stress UspA family protein